MRHLFSRFIWAGSLLTLACATAIDDKPLGLGVDDEEELDGGSAGKAGGPSVGSGGTGPSNSAGMASAGKGGSASSGFGGTSSKGGSSSGSAGSGGRTTGGSGGSAGQATGGSGGSATSGASTGGTAGMSNGGTTSGGGGAGGSASAGGTGGTGAALCTGIANWVERDYVMGEVVASTCSGVFHGACPEGQKHEFECRPPGANPELALPWCKTRPPGIANGWEQAWVDKGQCP